MAQTTPLMKPRASKNSTFQEMEKPYLKKIIIIKHLVVLVDTLLIHLYVIRNLTTFY